MGKTYKRIPYGSLRDPKGHRKYLAERMIKDDEAPPLRYGSIPPDPWDDIRVGRQVWIPYRACESMLGQGLSDDMIIKKLMRKFHITSSQAREVLKWKKNERK